VADHARPLSKRGRRDAPRIASRLAEAGWLPDRTLSSDSRRTRETWDRMHEALGTPPVDWLPSLYLATPATLFDALASLPSSDRCVVALGHNSGWEDALELLGHREQMTTCNAAMLESSATDWPTALQGPWTLLGMLRPRPPNNDLS
jgi:phosphohistidine phosphatase